MSVPGSILAAEQQERQEVQLLLFLLAASAPYPWDCDEIRCAFGIPAGEVEGGAAPGTIPLFLLCVELAASSLTSRSPLCPSATCLLSPFCARLLESVHTSACISHHL